jgi:hypothetical protein
MWTKIDTVKQLDPGNQPVTAFFSKFANLTSHVEVKGKNFTPKSRFGLSYGSRKSDVDKKWHSEAT